MREGREGRGKSKEKLYLKTELGFERQCSSFHCKASPGFYNKKSPEIGLLIHLYVPGGEQGRNNSTLSIVLEKVCIGVLAFTGFVCIKIGFSVYKFRM